MNKVGCLAVAGMCAVGDSDEVTAKESAPEIGCPFSLVIQYVADSNLILKHLLFLRICVKISRKIGG